MKTCSPPHFCLLCATCTGHGRRRPAVCCHVPGASGRVPAPPRRVQSHQGFIRARGLRAVPDSARPVNPANTLAMARVPLCRGSFRFYFFTCHSMAMRLCTPVALASLAFATRLATPRGFWFEYIGSTTFAAVRPVASFWRVQCVVCSTPCYAGAAGGIRMMSSSVPSLWRAFSNSYRGAVNQS